MAELSPQTTSSSDAVYRPLSALALIGFLVSCAFGVIVIVSAIIGLAQGAPFFFEKWVLIFAVAGFLLSYSGGNDIRNSEGTKAGAKLASWGMGLSLACGLGYFAYDYFTGLALTQQAHAFLTVADDGMSGFFPRLQKAGADNVELNRAFLMTLPGPDREGARPEDEAGMMLHHDQLGRDGSPGRLSRFREEDLVRIFLQDGAKLDIETLGVQHWEYKDRSYQVRRLYRVRSPEAVLDVVLTVKSSEAESEGKSRSWFVDVLGAQRAGWSLTPTGEGMRRLRIQAKGILNKMKLDLHKAGKLPEFALVDKTDWAKLPGEPELRTDLKAAMKAIAEGKFPPERLQFKEEMDKGGGMLRWRRDDQGRITIEVPASTVVASPTGMSHKALETLFEVRTKEPVDPERVAVAESPDELPGWDIVGITFKRAFVLMRPK